MQSPDSPVEPSFVSVSILTQPFGWVQHICYHLIYHIRVFQSSPNLSAGCSVVRTCRSPSFQSSPNLLVGCSAITCVSFNPRPTSRLGAVPHRWRNCWRRLPASVSILTQPLGWVHRYTGGSIAGFNPHPTLGWVQRAVAHSPFQSSPNLSVGCSRGSGIVVSILTQPLGRVQRAVPHSPFQSLPNLYSLDSAAGYAVSILTQPLGWVQSPRQSHPGPSHRCFNPHLTSRLGASPHRWQNRWGWGLVRFQSSPNRQVRCSIPVGADVGGLL